MDVVYSVGISFIANQTTLGHVSGQFNSTLGLIDEVSGHAAERAEIRDVWF